MHEFPIGTFRKCPARWCLGSSKWAFNGGHRYIRTRRTAAHPPAHTQTALMLALHWPSEPRPLDPLPFGHWSRRTPVTIGIGRYRLSSLLARDGARNHSINRTVQRSTKPPVPEFFVRLARWAASLGSRTSYARWDNGHKGNSPENGTCGTISGSKPQAGVQMASQWELSARAALCRQLAKREPKSRIFWMAEAENWSRLSNESFRGEPEQKSVAACCERSRLSDGLGREAE